MKLLKPLLFVALSIGLGTAGCKKQIVVEAIDYGSIENNVYRNDYFPLSLEIPEDWAVHDVQTQTNIKEKGSDAVYGDDEYKKALVKASELSMVSLVSMTKFPVGEPVPSNPFLKCIAERVQHTPGIKTGEDYLFQKREVLASGQLNLSFSGEIHSETVANHLFSVLAYDLNVGSDSPVHQKMYAVVLKGYALAFVITFTDESEEAELMEILNTLSLG
ncbi:MAG: hypothetical protein GXY61_10100 [Lentisphaerae bacterium]|nr:hypothetical protein [Lentisphaerota bacterium]